MTAYLDSSVLLRRAFRQTRGIAEWPLIRKYVSSTITEIECLRTVDRFRHVEGLSEEEISRRRAAVFALLEPIELVTPNRGIVVRASNPFPTLLASLDAIHLATALAWRDRTGVAPVMATHDQALGVAARAAGLRVVGI